MKSQAAPSSKLASEPIILTILPNTKALAHLEAAAQYPAVGAG